MSDTEAEIEAAPEVEIPGFTLMESAPLTSMGRTFPRWKITFGTRSATFRKLDLGDNWDLMELSGANSSERWFGMAMIAAGIDEIDNVPMKPAIDGFKKTDLRTRLAKLGEDGLQAMAKAMRMVDPPSAPASADQMAAAAKN